MYTSYDKAIVALIMAIVYLLNNLFGANINLDVGMVNNFVVGISPILVWLIPNKPTY